MAYHYQGRAWPDDVDRPQDALDACAYHILVAIFSLVEDGLEAQWTRNYMQPVSSTITRKLLEAWHADAEAEAQEPGKVLARLARLLPPKFKGERLATNPKLAHLYRQVVAAARAEAGPALQQAAARFCAAVKLANEPGEQCIAVVMDRDRNLYVAGNGLWASGPSFPVGEAVVTPPDWDQGQDREDHFQNVRNLQYEAESTSPWFTSRAATQLALELVSPDVIGEYGARRVIYISPTNGDSDGRFHAEMQLLDYMVARRIYPVRRWVGVSKPCCTHCAAGLRSAGLLFWTEHGARGQDPREDNRVAPNHRHFRDARACQEFREALARL